MNNSSTSLPNGFVTLNNPKIFVDLMYVSDDNFLGRPVRGYHANIAIMTIPALEALNQVQAELDANYPGYHLLIKDAYRPVDAAGQPHLNLSIMKYLLDKRRTK